MQKEIESKNFLSILNLHNQDIVYSNKNNQITIIKLKQENIYNKKIINNRYDLEYEYEYIYHNKYIGWFSCFDDRITRCTIGKINENNYWNSKRINLLIKTELKDFNVEIQNTKIEEFILLEEIQNFFDIQLFLGKNIKVLYNKYKINLKFFIIKSENNIIHIFYTEQKNIKSKDFCETKQIIPRLQKGKYRKFLSLCAINKIKIPQYILDIINNHIKSETLL